MNKKKKIRIIPPYPLVKGPEGICKSLQKLVVDGHKFGTLYIDPPWIYDNQGTRASTGNHYEGLTVDQLCDPSILPIRELAADNAHLHLWTTNGFLFECPKLFEAWGFEFKSSFVWVKSTMGMGNYWRNSHEILLTAIRGKNAKHFDVHNLISWHKEPRGKHSAKPNAIRDMIAIASPTPRIELFARRESPGWLAWGNQLEQPFFNLKVA